MEEYSWLPLESVVKSTTHVSAHSYAYSTPFSEVSQIKENLYLTSIAGLTPENFCKYNFRFLVDICEKPFYFPQNIEYRCFRIEDKNDSNLKAFMDEFADEIHKNLTQEKKILVHCLAGASRSGALIIAYLMKYHRLSLQEAFKFIRARRTVVRPNNGFFQQLIEYEEQLFGKCSAQMVKYSSQNDNVTIQLPDFFLTLYPDLVDKEIGYARNTNFFY